MAFHTTSMGSIGRDGDESISASAFVRTSLQPTFRYSLSLHSLTHYTIMSATRGKVSSVGVWLSHELNQIDSTSPHKSMAPRLRPRSGPRKLGEPYSLGLNGET
jgi:hypothetical protein